MYPAVLLMYFISAAVILLASLALTVQVSLPYKNTGRASVFVLFYSCLLTSSKLIKAVYASYMFIFFVQVSQGGWNVIGLGGFGV